MELVHYVAHMFRNTGHQYDDLVGIGMIGFTKALNSYTKNRDTKVSTYSITCIKNEILHFLRRERKHIKNNIPAETVIYKHSEGKTITLLDVLSDDDLNLENNMVVEENRKELIREIQKLPEREQIIIEHRYGLNNKDILKQRELAVMLKMTQANVSKLETGIIEKLLKVLENKGIEEYID